LERLDLSPEELLTTTRTVRKRLDFDRPVDRSTVEACLRLAFQAPNGSNQQTWGWVVVDDPDTRQAMGDIYRVALGDYVSRPRSDDERRAKTPSTASTASTASSADTPARRRMAESVMYLTEHIHEAPVLLVPTFHGRVDDKPVFWQASRWGSIVPGVWSFMLALRLHGLGSAWTTLHLLREREMGELLGIPDTETQAGMFPVAYTKGTDFKPADRAASEERIRWNRW
jgi:nitroreductase